MNNLEILEQCKESLISGIERALKAELSKFPREVWESHFQGIMEILNMIVNQTAGSFGAILLLAEKDGGEAKLKELSMSIAEGFCIGVKMSLPTSRELVKRESERMRARLSTYFKDEKAIERFMSDNNAICDSIFKVLESLEPEDLASETKKVLLKLVH